jgi:hypothetical protein
MEWSQPESIFWGVMVAGSVIGITQFKVAPIVVVLISIVTLFYYRSTKNPPSSPSSYSLEPAVDPSPPNSPLPPVNDPTMNTQVLDYGMTSAIHQPEPVAAREGFLQAVFARS